MEDRNSLYQYVVEMENWLEQFQYTMQELEKNQVWCSTTTHSQIYKNSSIN